MNEWHADELRLEIAKIGNVGDYIMVVFTDDCKQIPHFHLLSINDPLDQRFDISIKIESAEYCDHDGNSNKLIGDDIDCVIAFLSSEDVCMGIQGWTHWKSPLVTWNKNNDLCKIDINTPMPDYKKINKDT